MSETKTKPRVAAERFPKSMGACADLLHQLKTQRSEAQKVADALEAREKALKEYIIDNLSKDSTGAIGTTHKVQVIRKLVPSVRNWDELYSYIKKNNAWQLMQRRVSETAVQELWDAKKKVPGVEAFQAVTVSLTKI